MIPEIHGFLLIAGFLLLLGAASNRLSIRFNLPILLMFLAVGMICGSGVLGIVNLSGDLHAGGVNILGTVALCFILYSGGMDTGFNSIQPVLGRGALLATIGVILTALLLGVGAWLIFFAFGYEARFSWCLLLGAIISSTDAAAVFAVLRGRGIALKGRLRPLLELESGSNDPMAYLLVITLISLVLEENSAGWLLPLVLIYKMAMGVLIGVGSGVLGQYLYRLKLDYEGLYYVIGISLVLLAYGFAEQIGGNGMMSVYVCGMTMGNLRFNFRNGLSRFSDGIAWLMQVALFTTLGLLVNPDELVGYQVWIPGILLSLVLLFVARPVAVCSCLAGSSFNWRERLFISWVGLRGAAPIVLATFPLAAGVEFAPLLFNMIFFMVIASVVIQGSTIMPTARRLQLDKPVDNRPRIPLEFEITSSSSRQEMFEFEVPPDAAFADEPLSRLALPEGVLVLMVRRGDGFVSPRGNTVLKRGDGLLMLGDEAAMAETAKKFFPGSDYRPIRSYEEIARSYRALPTLPQGMLRFVQKTLTPSGRN